VSLEIFNDPKHTAVHEAGHAVIARVLGLRCGELTIVANLDEGYAGCSHASDPWLTVDDWERAGRYREHDIRQAYRGYVLGLMAGAEAEIEILGEAEEDGDADDRHWIIRAAWSSDSGIGASRWHRYEPRLRRQARRLVRKHREKIERVANALLERRTLTKEEADRLVEE
jgi:hypothetical protein